MKLLKVLFYLIFLPVIFVFMVFSELIKKAK
jgi:hypothetical protein